jgi:cysteine-rich repeat protein
VLLIAGRDSVHGFVVSGGTVYPFGPDGAGGHRSYALRDADPQAYPPPGDFCANDLHPDVVDTPAAHLEAMIATGFKQPAVAPVAATALLQADVAIETDYELRAKFASDQAALDYLASLAAASTAVYERDVAVRLRFSYVRLWASAGDPWTATSTTGALDEVRAYWTNPANDMAQIAGPRDIVHFVSGKSVSGGVAYVGAVCSQQYGFGVSQVFGSFDLANPSQIWDVLVVTHELGHNLGSPHTHCYDPPVDECYNRESSCYDGPVVASRGTIMSYCHLLAGGLSNVDLVFGDRPSAQMRNTVASASCLQNVSTCGDGVVDAGEQCDDGNSTAGDGCSPSCQIEVCGNHLVDFGETCDDGNRVSGDGCSATCQREGRCGDGVVDSGETCDDGNTSSGDGCSATCQREPRCGDGVVDPGEQCDDGNTVRGDGCSQRCKLERCKVQNAGQTLWPRAKVMLQHTRAGDRLSVRGVFGIPASFDSLAPGTTGVLVRLENADGEKAVEIALPGGPQWLTRPDGWVYVDPAGAVNGIRKLTLRDRTRGDVPEVELVAHARDGAYPFAAVDLPLALTVVLGDEGAGLAGTCGRYGFGGTSCAPAKRGNRLVCR